MTKISMRVHAWAEWLAGRLKRQRESDEFWRGYDWGEQLPRDNETSCWAARMETRHITGGPITDFERGAMRAIGRPLQPLQDHSAAAPDPAPTEPAARIEAPAAAPSLNATTPAKTADGATTTAGND